jgi:hypothetical protein
MLYQNGIWSPLQSRDSAFNIAGPTFQLSASATGTVSVTPFIQLGIGIPLLKLELEAGVVVYLGLRIDADLAHYKWEVFSGADLDLAINDICIEAYAFCASLASVLSLPFTTTTTLAAERTLAEGGDRASWVAGPWSACPGCGGDMTRSVVCRSALGFTVAETECADVKPAATVACNSVCDTCPTASSCSACLALPASCAWCASSSRCLTNTTGCNAVWPFVCNPEPILNLTWPLAGATVKAGNTTVLRWTGGAQSVSITLISVDGTQFDAVSANLPTTFIANQQSFAWTPPGGLSQQLVQLSIGSASAAWNFVEVEIYLDGNDTRWQWVWPNNWGACQAPGRHRLLTESLRWRGRATEKRNLHKQLWPNRSHSSLLRFSRVTNQEQFLLQAM